MLICFPTKTEEIIAQKYVEMDTRLHMIIFGHIRLGTNATMETRFQEMAVTTRAGKSKVFTVLEAELIIIVMVVTLPRVIGAGGLTPALQSVEIGGILIQVSSAMMAIELMEMDAVEHVS